MFNNSMPNRELLYQEFGILLAAERKRKHLSQAQLGARVGLSRTSVTNIECGRQPIQLHQLFTFASVLKIDPAKLLPKEPNLSALEPADVAQDGRLTQYLEMARKALNGAQLESGGGGNGRQDRN